MCTADAAHSDDSAFGAGSGRNFESAPDALRMAAAAMDYLNTTAPATWPGAPTVTC